MISAAGLATAVLAGLVGGAHCAGMCGGLATAVRRARVIPIKDADAAAQPRTVFPLEQFGRLSGYMLVGALAGSGGTLIMLVLRGIPLQAILFGLFNIGLILLGARMLGWRPVANTVGAAGAWLWARMQPLTKNVWPPRTASQRYLAGLAWGLIPCGLVYSVLPLAFLAGEPVDGALLMLAFGVGTMPGLLAAGWGLDRIGLTLSGRWPRVARAIAGTAVIGWGTVGVMHAAMAGQHPVRLLDMWCGPL